MAWDHHVFLVTDDGVATCWEAKTGKQCWQERLGRRHHASPIVAEGRIYVDRSRRHNLRFGGRSPKFEVLAKNAFGEECFASPAAADGNLFYRTVESSLVHR